MPSNREGWQRTELRNENCVTYKRTGEKSFPLLREITGKQRKPRFIPPLISPGQGPRPDGRESTQLSQDGDSAIRRGNPA